MTDLYDRKARELGEEIRRILRDQGLYNNNIEFEFKIGRYKVRFDRSHGKNEVLRNLPDQIFDVARQVIEELHEMWENEPNEEEQLGEHSRSEYSVFI